MSQAPPAPPPPAPARAPAQASSPKYIHPGRGWGPVDDAGLSTHELCKGTGRIEHDNGNGKKSRVMCQPCGGQGTKRCLAKPAKTSLDGRWA